MAKKSNKIIGRIRYEEHYVIGNRDEGEHYIFEWKYEDEDENQWNMESAFPLVSFKEGEIVCGSGDFIHYTALTKVREWMKQGVISYILWK